MSSPAISAGLSHRLRLYLKFFFLFFNNPSSKGEHRVRQLRTAVAFDKCWKEMWAHKLALSTMMLQYMRHHVMWRWWLFPSHSLRRQCVISAPTARDRGGFSSLRCLLILWPLVLSASLCLSSGFHVALLPHCQIKETHCYLVSTVPPSTASNPKLKALLILSHENSVCSRRSWAIFIQY